MPFTVLLLPGTDSGPRLPMAVKPPIEENDTAQLVTDKVEPEGAMSCDKGCDRRGGHYRFEAHFKNHADGHFSALSSRRDEAATHTELSTIEDLCHHILKGNASMSPGDAHPS